MEPNLYHEERGKLLELLGDLIDEAHHVGSTSIVGLAAKPKIDIDAVLRETTDVWDSATYSVCPPFGCLIAAADAINMRGTSMFSVRSREMH